MHNMSQAVMGRYLVLWRMEERMTYMGLEEPRKGSRASGTLVWS